MVRKSVGTILGLCSAVLVFANSPTVKADGHEAGQADLPQVFKLSNRGGNMSDELVSRLLTITAVNRLQAAAKDDEELNALKYDDTMAALQAVGVDWSGDTEIQMTRDEAANEDVITIIRPNREMVLRYDDAGKQIVSDEAEAMGARGGETSFDTAVACCWGVGSSGFCQDFGTCAEGAEKCYSSWFTPAYGYKGNYMICAAAQ